MPVLRDNQWAVLVLEKVEEESLSSVRFHANKNTVALHCPGVNQMHDASLFFSYFIHTILHPWPLGFCLIRIQFVV
jgi:hypothetical protein